MPSRACMTEGASNYGMDANGNFVGDQPDVLHFAPMCEFGTGMDEDEEDRAIALGNTDYTTHEEAKDRGNAINTDRDRNRSAYVDSQTTNKKMNLLPIAIILGILMI